MAETAVQGGKIMKCPKCGGNAELSNWGSLFDPDYADFHVQCEKCGYHSMGSTDPQKAQEMFLKEMGMHYTNEAWIKQCTAEQLAELLDKMTLSCYICGQDGYNENPRHCIFGRCTGKEDIFEWLKQPHKE